jgi:Ca-activated chloride channel family protein
VSFAAPWFLLGCGGAALLALLLLIAGLRASRARKVFGDAPRVASLVTHEAATRRAWKGVLLVTAAALAFLAAARPQYGKGTRLVPATDVDVILVLDLSKSMYARDIEPSRVFRAKAELTRMVRDLPGVRFGAVAFAGEPMGFPMSADGAAVAQFLRQLEPNDMPVGGTAIGRALDMARDLFARDPLSQKHHRIIVLVTDGEDLEGSPGSVARAIGSEGTTIHVVQIGGRTSERIPEVGADGSVLGWRRTDDGRYLTTELTPEGEAQLSAIAAATPGGQIIRAERGETGIDALTEKLKTQRTSENAERVETVYADVFYVPLLLAIALLLIEALIFEAPARTPAAPQPRPPQKSRGAPVAPGLAVAGAAGPGAVPVAEPPSPWARGGGSG